MIPFSCLNRDNRELDEISAELDALIRRGRYVLSDKVLEFEETFGKYAGRKYALGVGNATDALYLIFRSLDAKRIALCASNPLPCGQAIKMAGAEMILIDAEDKGGLIDLNSLREKDEKIDAVLAVHLYGQAEKTNELKKICEEKSIFLIEDCSQSAGTFAGREHTGKAGILSAFSFYPTKNLGAFGDGGLVATDSEELYEKILRMRNYGQIETYSAQTEGINSRLDEMQAAVLLVKMKRLKEKNERRKKIIERYRENIKNKKIELSTQRYFETSNGHIMPIFTECRDSLRDHMKKMGVMTAVHYPYPLHRQNYFRQNLSLPVSEWISARELSIPSFPELSDEEVETVIEAVNSYE